MDPIRLSDTCILDIEHRFIDRSGIIITLSSLQTCILDRLAENLNEPVSVTRPHDFHAKPPFVRHKKFSVRLHTSAARCN